LSIRKIRREFARFTDVDYFEIEINDKKYIKNSCFEEIVKNVFNIQLNKSDNGSVPELL